MDSDIVPETAEHEPYPLQFGHVVSGLDVWGHPSFLDSGLIERRRIHVPGTQEGGEYELRSEELGPGRVERAGSLGQQREF